MSAQQMVLAWEQPDLTASERLVLLALADCADREGRNAFRSERTIAEHCQIDRRTVQRCMKALVERGLIVVQELPTARRSTTYTLRLQGRQNAASGNDQTGAMQGRQIAASQGRQDVASGAARGATFTHARGGNYAFPPTPPYKEDPVFEPVDPALARLLAKFGSESLRRSPEAEHTTHLEAMRMAARGRGWPHDPLTLAAALNVALAEQTAARGVA